MHIFIRIKKIGEGGDYQPITLLGVPPTLPWAPQNSKASPGQDLTGLGVIVPGGARARPSFDLLTF
jgi:hypothetical protein